MYELGHELVVQLELEERNDTLGRWMAHHLAELICAAEGAPVNSGIRNQAAELIIKLWNHRFNERNNLNPLNDFASAVAVLSTLYPKRNAWLARHHMALSAVYNGVRRLVLAMAIRDLDLSAVSKAVSRASRTKRWQTNAEKLVVDTFENWLTQEQKSALVQRDKARPKKAQAKKSEGAKPSVSRNYSSVALEAISDIQADLEKLIAQLSTKEGADLESQIPGGKIIVRKVSKGGRVRKR